MKSKLKKKKKGISVVLILNRQWNETEFFLPPETWHDQWPCGMARNSRCLKQWNHQTQTCSSLVYKEGMLNTVASRDMMLVNVLCRLCMHVHWPSVTWQTCLFQCLVRCMGRCVLSNNKGGVQRTILGSGQVLSTSTGRKTLLPYWQWAGPLDQYGKVCCRIVY